MQIGRSEYGPRQGRSAFVLKSRSRSTLVSKFDRGLETVAPCLVLIFGSTVYSDKLQVAQPCVGGHGNIIGWRAISCTM